LLKKREIILHAAQLRFNLQEVLEEDLGCGGTVSLACCYDVIEHHDRDMDRLYTVHQPKKLVHLTKHIGYLAFWIRKLKPVDSSYPAPEIEEAARNKRSIDETKEVRDINERICLWYMFHLLRASIGTGQLPTPPGLSADKFQSNLDAVFLKFRKEPAGGPVLADQFDVHVYDMRYRTFGPHHLVNLANYLISEAAHDRGN
jgi:hypothetical protein